MSLLGGMEHSAESIVQRATVMAQRTEGSEHGAKGPSEIVNKKHFTG